MDKLGLEPRDALNDKTSSFRSTIIGIVLLGYFSITTTASFQVLTSMLLIDNILSPEINADSGKKEYHPFHDKGSIGVFLKGFFGYNSNPNIPEVILWFISLCFGLNLWRKFYL